MPFILHSLLAAAAATPSPVDAVEAFVRAGDRRDVQALEGVMHPDFRVLARMPDGLSVMPRSVYLDLIKGGKIGGVTRETDVDVVLLQGDLATVKGTLDSAAAHFDCTWTVAKTSAGWQVIQDAVVFAPKTP